MKISYETGGAWCATAPGQGNAMHGSAEVAVVAGRHAVMRDVENSQRTGRQTGELITAANVVIFDPRMIGEDPVDRHDYLEAVYSRAI